MSTPSGRDSNSRTVCDTVEEEDKDGDGDGGIFVGTGEIKIPKGREFLVAKASASAEK